MNKIGVFNPRDPNAYRCCLCCHVKVGTVIYGLTCLVLDLFCLGVVIFLSIRPDILAYEQLQAGIRGPEYDGINFDNPHTDFQINHKDDISAGREGLCMAYAAILLSLLTTISLLFGVIKHRPGFMMPFFCLHVFLFCLNCLTVVSYFTYAPSNIKLWIRETGLERIPGMEHIMAVDPDYLVFFVITILILALCLKAYLIAMIWACYKYVQQVVESRTMLREYQVEPDSEMLLPPRYEDAIKIQAVQAATTQPPPPPYAS